LIAGPEGDLQKLLGAADAWLAANPGSGAIVRDSTGALVQVLMPIPVIPPPAPLPQTKEDVVAVVLKAIEGIGGDVTAVLDQLQPLLQTASQIETLRQQITGAVEGLGADIKQALDLAARLQPLLQMGSQLEQLLATFGIHPSPPAPPAPPQSGDVVGQ
jgi:hypothetical protein